MELRGVELRGFWCGTEGFVLNWGVFGVELRDFWGWKGVVQKWNWCVELRGSVWNWGVLVLDLYKFKIWKHFRSALFNLRILSLSDGLSDPISQFPRMPTMETSEILNSVTANYRQLKRRRLLPPKSPKVSNKNSLSYNIRNYVNLTSFNVTQFIAGIITSLVILFSVFYAYHWILYSI